MLLLLQSHIRITDKNHHLEEQLGCATRKIRQLESTVQENEALIEANETKIEELERFSMGVANVQKAIASETDLGRKFELLESGDYAEDKDVQEWNYFTDHFLEAENDMAPYIKTLKDSIEVYRNTILPRFYPSRFISLFSNVPPNVGFDTYLGTFYKIHIPYHLKCMQVNESSSIDQFKQKCQKDVRGFRTSKYVTSYIENDCLQVFFNNQLTKFTIITMFFGNIMRFSSPGKLITIEDVVLKQGHVFLCAHP